MRDSEKGPERKGAYLHMASDAVISFGVGNSWCGIIYFTHWCWLDSVVSLVIMVVILYGTWGLLADSVRLSLDAVPRNIDIGRLEKFILKNTRYQPALHHIHVWALSTQVNASNCAYSDK